MLRKLIPYMKGYEWSAIIGPVLIVVEIVCELILPLLMANIIDIGINGGAGLTYILKQGGLMVALACLCRRHGDQVHRHGQHGLWRQSAKRHVRQDTGVFLCRH